jgi:hypothetical protein
MQRCCDWGLLSALGACLCLGLPCRSAGPAGAGAITETNVAGRGELYWVRWRVDLLAKQWCGQACWLRGESQALRAEVRWGPGCEQGDETGLGALMQRRGEGWTLAIAGPEAATINAWGRSWREVNPEVVAWASLITGLIEQGRVSTGAMLGGKTRVLPPLRRLPQTPRWIDKRVACEAESRQRIELRFGAPRPGVDEGFGCQRGDFRFALNHRGWGRGGDGEIVLARLPAPANGDDVGLQLRSSRRWGRLEIAITGRRSVVYPEPECFLPIWSLAELIDFTAVP